MKETLLHILSVLFHGCGFCGSRKCFVEECWEWEQYYLQYDE